MKKKLVASLAAAMVLGVAGTSFAASNPFVDVPAKHWAYDSVTKLSQAGIVDGYGDGKFQGDKMISRYEMAQIVAKAMARSDKADAKQKAEIEKLAKEFAVELEGLNVRVDKLEKNASTVKMTGDARVRWNTMRLDKAAPYVSAVHNDSKFQERIRFNLTSNINENTSIYSRMMINQTEMGTDNKNNNNVVLSDIAITTKDAFNTGAETTIGRFSQSLLSTGYVLSTQGLVDGFKVTAGNKVKVTAGYANFANATSGFKSAGKLADGTATAAVQTIDANSIENAFFAAATYDASKATKVYGAYLKENNDAISANYDIRGIGFATKFAKNWTLLADYSKNTAEAAKSAGESPVLYVTKLMYKGANAKVQGTYGVGVEYFRADQYSIPTTTDNDTASSVFQSTLATGNQKAYALSFGYTIAKNAVFNSYQTFKTKTSTPGSASVEIPNYTRAQIDFTF